MKTRYFLIALLIVILDQATKWWADLRLVTDAVEILPGYLRLALVHNTGVAFGLFSNHVSAWKPYMLGGMAVIALIVIFLYARRAPADRQLLQCGLATTMGGILGNLLDRIFRGYVVDFIEFHIHESFYWPNFNVADSAITIGVALLLIDTVTNPAVDEVADHPVNGRS